eukprot:gene33709-28413_t
MPRPPAVLAPLIMMAATWGARGAVVDVTCTGSAARDAAALNAATSGSGVGDRIRIHQHTPLVGMMG